MTDQAKIITEMKRLYEEALHNSLRNPAKTIELCDRILGLAEPITEKNETVALALYLKGRNYFELWQYDDALNWSQQAGAYADRHAFLNVKSMSLGTIGHLHLSNNDYHSALKVYQKSLELAQKARSDENEFHAYVNICSVHTWLEDYETALVYADKALAILPCIESEAVAAFLFFHMARIYHNQNQPDLALEYYQKSIRLFEASDLISSAASAYGNMGLVYSNSNRYDPAIDCHQKALALNRRTGNKLGVAMNLHNIGLIYQERGEYEKAMENLTLAQSEFFKQNNKYAYLNSLLAMGKIHTELEQYEQGIDLLLLSMQLARELNIPKQTKIAHKYLAIIYKKMASDCAESNECYQESIRHYEAFIELQEQLYNEDAAQRVHKLQARFEVKEKEYENRIYQMKIEQQRKELTSLIHSLAQKNGLIQRLQQQIAEIKGRGDGDLVDGLTALGSEFEAMRADQRDWQTFEAKFNRVYHGFTQELAKQYPMLSRQELKICALTKVGLSIKETAYFLNRSTKDVESHRYNIRKKLELSPSQNLVQFLNAIIRVP